jgi:trehalose synthase
MAFRLKQVSVPPLAPQRFQEVLEPEEYRWLLGLIERAQPALRGRVIWNVNSTARGGGVVELLRSLLGYSRGAGIDTRWMVIRGDEAFFRVTKRLHNRLHGEEGDGGPLGEHEHELYERALAPNAARLADLVRRQDIILLHDPQTAGLVDAMKATGAKVIWRAHVGRDHPNELAREAWEFLRGYVGAADAFVFSRQAFVWEGLEPERVRIIHPSIDVFSPKNESLSDAQVVGILFAAGLLTDGGYDATFTRFDGTPGRVDRRAHVVQDAPLRPDDRVVTQVSRWDRLKDPLGVLQGFAEHVADHRDFHLVLAGPAVDAVADDPEGREVWQAVREAREDLAPEARWLVHLATLPMYDTEENAAIVNALQRHARVVVQKSLAEGFGLTVMEAMWKARPVVASAVGGIQDQVVDGESGVLLRDPHDLAEFGTAVRGLLEDPERAERIGEAAQRRAREHYLGPRHLGQYFELFQTLG